MASEQDQPPTQAEIIDERLRDELRRLVAQFVQLRVGPAGKHLRRRGGDPEELLRGVATELRSLADRVDPDSD